MIRLFYDTADYRLREKKKVLSLIEKVIRKENRVPGDLNFIFVNDESLLEINKEFLKHNYNTDVIAFGYNENKILNGEIYISIDSVKNNANNYKVSLENEILRVMIHGTLHLCGYDDRNKSEKERMKRMEDFWIKFLKELV